MWPSLNKARICIACLKLVKAPKFLLRLKFFSHCTQSKSKQQSRRNRNSLAVVLQWNDFKTITSLKAFQLLWLHLCFCFTYLLRSFTNKNKPWMKQLDHLCSVTNLSNYKRPTSISSLISNGFYVAIYDLEMIRNFPKLYSPFTVVGYRRDEVR